MGFIYVLEWWEEGVLCAHILPTQPLIQQLQQEKSSISSLTSHVQTDMLFTVSGARFVLPLSMWDKLLKWPVNVFTIIEVML